MGGVAVEVRRGILEGRAGGAVIGATLRWRGVRSGLRSGAALLFGTAFLLGAGLNLANCARSTSLEVPFSLQYRPTWIVRPIYVGNWEPELHVIRFLEDEAP